MLARGSVGADLVTMHSPQPDGCACCLWHDVRQPQALIVVRGAVEAGDELPDPKVGRPSGIVCTAAAQDNGMHLLRPGWTAFQKGWSKAAVWQVWQVCMGEHPVP